MKLAICYTVFDGLELLEKSVQTMAPHVDEIIICYQNVSNKGNADYGIINWLETTFHKYTNIYFVEYEADLKLNPKENERRKHQTMIQTAKFLECTHFIMAATDHFYTDMDVKYAKRIVSEKDYDVTFSSMYTYYKKPTWQLDTIEKYFMPFICKLHPHTQIEKVPYFPLRVDPSVQVNTFNKWYCFHEKEVMLHHYSMIRKDIRSKYENAASPWNQEQIERFVSEFDNYTLKENPGIYYFHGTKIKEVPDYFNLASCI